MTNISTATSHDTDHLLRPDEIEAYRRDGYLVPRFRLTGDDLTLLQGLIGQLVEDNPDRLDKAMVSPHIPGGGVQNLKVKGGWLPISTHPRIVDIVSQLIGPDVILWGSTVFYKRAAKGPMTAWHRDGQAWPIRPLATTTVWIAASPSTRENGCLRVIPGSHAGRQLGRHVYEDRPDMMVRLSLDPSEVDEDKAVDVELQAGEMVIFDVYTIHGARHNFGTIPRAGYALRFMPATSHFDHDGAFNRNEPGYAHETRGLILVRGVDACGRNDFQRGHPGASQNRAPAQGSA